MTRPWSRYTQSLEIYRKTPRNSLSHSSRLLSSAVRCSVAHPFGPCRPCARTGVAGAAPRSAPPTRATSHTAPPSSPAAGPPHGSFPPPVSWMPSHARDGDAAPLLAPSPLLSLSRAAARLCWPMRLARPSPRADAKPFTFATKRTQPLPSLSAVQPCAPKCLAYSPRAHSSLASQSLKYKAATSATPPLPPARHHTNRIPAERASLP